MSLVSQVIGTEFLAVSLMVAAGLWQTRTRRPAFRAPWDGYRGKRRMGAAPDRDWVIA